jgi:hypothetical protein
MQLFQRHSKNLKWYMNTGGERLLTTVLQGQVKPHGEQIWAERAEHPTKLLRPDHLLVLVVFRRTPNPFVYISPSKCLKSINEKLYQAAFSCYTYRLLYL